MFPYGDQRLSYATIRALSKMLVYPSQRCPSDTTPLTTIPFERQPLQVSYVSVKKTLTRILLMCSPNHFHAHVVTTCSPRLASPQCSVPVRLPVHVSFLLAIHHFVSSSSVDSLLSHSMRHGDRLNPTDRQAKVEVQDRASPDRVISFYMLYMC